MYPLVIDGGLSNELERQGCVLNDKLWSARFLDSNPEAIINAHLSYLMAGARCITTASYQATLSGFMEMGFDRATAEALIPKSVALAEEAIQRYKALGHKTDALLIAASIGPYGAYLADGSEYRGDYGISDEALKDFHSDRIRLLDDSKADLFACETIPSLQEAKVLAEILQTTKKSAWISFSCKDDAHLNDGTPIEKVVMHLADHPNIFALGINCTAPEHISGLVRRVKAHAKGKKIIVYPNSGEVYNAESKTWLGLADPHSFVAMSKEWSDLGADILGGCCRIGPDHIRSLSSEISEAPEY